MPPLQYPEPDQFRLHPQCLISEDI